MVDVTWSSSNESEATVVSTGQNTATITAVKATIPGYPVTITATNPYTSAKATYQLDITETGGISIGID